MKNSKKCDFKKLALLGITGGTMLATQAVEAEILNASELMATNACGGMQACGGSRSMGSSGSSYQAYRNIPSQDAYYYNSAQPYAACGSAYPQYYPSTSTYDGGMPQYYQSSPQYYPSSPQYYQPTSYPSMPGGYSSNQPQQWDSMMPTYQASSQPSQGCGGAAPASGMSAAPTTGMSAAPASMTNEPMTAAPASDNSPWTQWETADNTKTMYKGTMQQDRGSMQQDSGSMMQQDRNTRGSQKQMTESELLSQLNEEGKRTYNNLDAAGKALALKMASQDTFKDKNLAVKAAALKMSEKRGTPASSKY